MTSSTISSKKMEENDERNGRHDVGRNLIIFTAVMCALLIITGLVSLIMWIVLYSNNEPEIKAIHEERNYFVESKGKEDMQNWVGETAGRQHVLSQPKIHKNQTYDFKSEDGLRVAEFKMASRVRRMARQLSSSNEDACVDRTFGFYPDYSQSCKVFYLCLRGRQRTFMCPNGQVFDRRNLDCVEDSIEQQVCKPRQMTCTSKTIHFYPDFRTNCKRFFMCLNGVTHYYGCPGDMVFSPNLLACVPKTVYDCKDPYLAVEIGVIRIEHSTTTTTTTPLPTTTTTTTTQRPTTTTTTTQRPTTTTTQRPTTTTTQSPTTTTQFTPRVIQEIETTTSELAESRPGTLSFHNKQNYTSDSTVYHGFIYTKPMREQTGNVPKTVFEPQQSIKTINSPFSAPTNLNGKTDPPKQEHDIFAYTKPNRNKSSIAQSIEEKENPGDQLFVYTKPNRNSNLGNREEVQTELPSTEGTTEAQTAVTTAEQAMTEKEVTTTESSRFPVRIVTAKKVLTTQQEITGVTSGNMSIVTDDFIVEVNATANIDPEDRSPPETTVIPPSPPTTTTESKVNTNKAPSEMPDTMGKANSMKSFFQNQATTQVPSTTAMQVLVIVRGKPCNGNMYRPDYKSDCRKFYWCVRGQERLYTCPRNKKFSVQFKKCTNPEEVFCGEANNDESDTEGRVRYPSSDGGSTSEKYGDWLKIITPRGAVRVKDGPRASSRWWPKYEFERRTIPASFSMTP